MTRFRFMLALCMALLLIGVATWKRFEGSPSNKPDLAAIQNGNNIQITQDDANSAALAEGQAELGAASADASTTALTNTDLIGRQMMANYFNLASNGEATDDNLDLLANSYADNIAATNTFTPKTADQLDVVADSEQSFQAYSNTLSNIYDKYKGLVAASVKSSGDMSDITSSGFANGMSALSSIYIRAANELASMPVPSTLSALHLKLVNSYLSSSESLAALSNVGSDATRAFAALTSESENNANQSDILQSIESVLVVKGNPLTASI